MTQLCELARLIRSKNAGPFQLTFDIMFEKPEVYERVKTSNVFTREKIAPLFRQKPEDVDIYFCKHARAIKVSIPRPHPQGGLGDSDGHGGQQYVPLMGLEIA
jgi:hypothetical protein